LFYFGWGSTYAFFDYFGVDSGVLGLSVADYLLRSVRPAYPFLLALGFAVILGVVAHRWLQSETADYPDRLRRVAHVITGIAVFSVVAGLAVATAIDNGTLPDPPWGPLLMFAGFAGIAYAEHLKAQPAGRSATSLLGALLTLALLSLFGTVAAYADLTGRQAAQRLHRHLPDAAEVVVFSEVDLGLEGPGVTASPVASPTSHYRFRYGGLRLLVAAGDRYFLLPKDWQPGNGTVIIVPGAADDQAVRLEFYRHPTAARR
jgi:hypothetical protein